MQIIEWQKLSWDELHKIFISLDAFCKSDCGFTRQKDIATAVGIDHTRYNKAFKGTGSEVGNDSYIKYIALILEKIGIEIIHENDRFNFKKTDIKRPDSEQKHLHFIYYYIANTSNSKEFKIRKAHLEINTEAKTAELNFYVGINKSVTYSGKTSSIDGQTFFYFNKRASIISNDAKDIPAINYIDCSWESLFYKTHIVGAFASYGPASGVAILEKIKSADIQKAIQDTSVPPEIVRMMIGKRFSAKLNDRLFDLEYNRTIVEKIQHLNGSYIAFCLESSNDRESIHKLKFEISDGCLIKFFSKYTDEHKGYIIDYQNDNLICAFDYNFDRAYFDIHMNLKAHPETNQDGLPDGVIMGVYTGLEKNNNPMGGRVILIPADSSNSYAESKVRMYRMSNTEEMNDLDKEYPYLKDFLTGKYDRYLDSPLLLQDFNFLKKTQEKIQSKIDQSIEPFASAYYNYRVSSSGEVIYKTPFKIYADGNVVWWLKDDDTEGEKLKGKASILANGILSLFFNITEDGKDAKCHHHLIYLGNRRTLGGIHFLEGVSTSFTHDTEPRCSREIYEIAEFEHIYDQIMEQYPGEDLSFAEDKNWQKIYQFLSGGTGNVIVSNRQVNDKIFEENTRNIANDLFRSARIMAREDADTAVVLAILDKAFQHGFNNIKNLTYHIELGDLSRKDIASRIDIKNKRIIPNTTL